MNCKYIICLILSVIVIQFLPKHTNAQSKAKIENVDFFNNGSKLIVTYDIKKYEDDETFVIWLVINTRSGQKLTPNALLGDVGNNVRGGSYKRIVWDMSADQVFLDEDITVSVMAESNLSKKVEPKIEKQEKVKPQVTKTGISVAGAMGLSLALPGLGRRAVSRTGSAWILGVAGYACIGGAVYMNNSAYNAYEDYKKATTISQRDNYYQKAKNHDLYSKILIGSAATIWVVDLILTGIKAKNNRKVEYHDQRMSFVGSYDPVTKQPLIGLRYKL